MVLSNIESGGWGVHEAINLQLICVETIPAPDAEEGKSSAIYLEQRGGGGGGRGRQMCNKGTGGRQAGGVLDG
jgi:hypothetical protein